MIDWYQDAFAADPAGWISVWIALGVVILSAVFWKATWAVLKAIGRSARWMWRKIARIRITTVDRMKPTNAPLLIPPRWDVGMTKDGSREDFLLANFSEGSIATHVQLEVYGNEARLRSAGVWESINGGTVGQFKMVYSDMAFWHGVTFGINFTDANGERRYDSIELRSN